MVARAPSPAATDPPDDGEFDAAPRDRSAVRAWYTPSQLARERHVGIAKIHRWIRSGELLAINHASTRLSPPRWRISAEAVEAFDRSRSSRGSTPAAPTRSRRSKGIPVTEFFE